MIYHHGHPLRWIATDLYHLYQKEQVVNKSKNSVNVLFMIDNFRPFLALFELKAYLFTFDFRNEHIKHLIRQTSVHVSATSWKTKVEVRSSLIVISSAFKNENFLQNSNR